MFLAICMMLQGMDSYMAYTQHYHTIIINTEPQHVCNHTLTVKTNYITTPSTNYAVCVVVVQLLRNEFNYSNCLRNQEAQLLLR